MSEARICFEILGLAKDEDGKPCACGMQFSFGEDDRERDYAALTEGINISALLDAIGLDKVVSPENVRLISPKEYDQKYGNGD